MMDIGVLEFNTFCQSINGTLRRLGVSPADADAVTNVVLSFKNPICTIQGCMTSICDRYSIITGLTNTQLVTFVVNATVNAVTAAGAPTLPYFDGTVGTNFLLPANSALLTNLSNHLVQFFFIHLGCTIDPPMNYTGKTLQLAHQALCIPRAAFDFFNQALIGVLRGAGVVSVDLAAVLSLLNSTAGSIVMGGSVPSACGTVPPPPSNGVYCGTSSYTMTVVLKNNTHPQFGVGFVSGYLVNGYVQGAVINLYVGCTYTFSSLSACIHPLYVTDTPVAASTGNDTTLGITAADYTQICAGSSFSWAITPSLLTYVAQTSMQQLYYGCRVHPNMGWKVNILAAPAPGTTVPSPGAPTLASAVTPPPPPTQTPTSSAHHAVASSAAIVAVAAAALLV